MRQRKGVPLSRLAIQTSLIGIQGRVEYAGAIAAAGTVLPLSLDQNTRLRVVTAADEQGTAFDQDVPSPWDLEATDSGVTPTNPFTVINVWE